MSEEQKKIKNYNPIMSPYKQYKEINAYVVFWGLIFAVIFTLASWLFMFKNRSNSRCLCTCICFSYGNGYYV